MHQLTNRHSSIQLLHKIQMHTWRNKESTLMQQQLAELEEFSEHQLEIKEHWEIKQQEMVLSQEQDATAQEQD
jgi:hypothetical protein